MNPSADPSRALQQALALHQNGRLAEAEPLYRAVLQRDPAQFDALHYLGILKVQQREFDEAVALMTAALRVRPAAPQVLANRGLALQSLGRNEEALASYDRAVALKPDYADALFNRGNALQAMERYAEALASYDRALASRPDHAPALCNRGNALQLLGRHEEAIASYTRAVAARAGYAEAFANRGNAARALGRNAEAVADYRQALALRPDYPEALCYLGSALADGGRTAEAIGCYTRALALRPDYVDALMSLAHALAATGRYGDALPRYDAVLALHPGHTDAHFGRAAALHALGADREAVADYDQVLAARPHDARALHGRGIALAANGDHGAAAASFEAALKADPDAPYVAGDLAFARANLCDWTDFDALGERLRDGVREGRAVCAPFPFLMQDDPALQLACASACARDRYPAAAIPLWRGERYAHERIRIAYLSPDLREHAFAYLIAGLIERHDRARFEVFALSFGPGGESAMRARLAAAFDRFIDVRTKGDAESAALLRELEVDIAVDCAGFTENARPGILAQRPAPVQVAYLGYPGTMGAPYIDYVVADETVIPRADARHYSEQVVWLPDCYQVNDSQRAIAPHAPTRAEAGLPAEGFVFCCFNNSYKITPALFDVWMRILQHTPGSVLWLLGTRESAERNLRREATARGVDPARLVFAARVPVDEHLARHRLADLFIDTLPYNAHTTASDALWAGLPVLTCPGRTFAGRVAASLLRAVGMPELVAGTLHAYEARAVELASDRGQLTALRDRLARNRLTTPLFDTDRFRRHLEAAYTTMWQRQQRGEPPASFAVDAISSSREEPQQ